MKLFSIHDYIAMMLIISLSLMKPQCNITQRKLPTLTGQGNPCFSECVCVTGDAFRQLLSVALHTFSWPRDCDVRIIRSSLYSCENPVIQSNLIFLNDSKSYYFIWECSSDHLYSHITSSFYLTFLCFQSSKYVKKILWCFSMPKNVKCFSVRDKCVLNGWQIY